MKNFQSNVQKHKHQQHAKTTKNFFSFCLLLTVSSKTDGRPDSRPTVRERVPQLGDLRADFDFSRPPRKPLLLPPNP